MSYQQDALNTLSDQYHIGAIDPDLMHAAIGVATESGELLEAIVAAQDVGAPALDYVNITEELGDVMWYVAVACHSLHTTIEDVAALQGRAYQGPRSGGLIGNVLHLSIESSKLLDKIKRCVFYGSPLNTAAVQLHINVIIHRVMSACHAIDVSIEDAMASNIAKLRARFPDRFTTARALARDLNSERAALEDGQASR